MKRSCLLLFVALFLGMGACATTSGPDASMLPPLPTRQAELTVLFERFGAADAEEARAATRLAAQAEDRDRRYLVSLWGTRDSSAIGARRYAAALSATGLHSEALAWLERALRVKDTDDLLLAWIRYELAREMVYLGRNDDAIQVLTNRLGTTPLPDDLKALYLALIREAS